MPVPKKMRPAEDKYGGDSDHHSDGEGGVQPMMTKIKTVLKSEWWICLLWFQYYGAQCNMMFKTVYAIYLLHLLEVYSEVN